MAPRIHRQELGRRAPDLLPPEARMDPLVRSALWVQKVIARTSGIAASVGFGAFLVYAEAAEPTASWTFGVLGLFAVSLTVRLVQRLRRITPEETARLDLELFTHLCVLALGVIV